MCASVCGVSGWLAGGFIGGCLFPCLKNIDNWLCYSWVQVCSLLSGCGCVCVCLSLFLKLITVGMSTHFWFVQAGQPPESEVFLMLYYVTVL